MGVHAKYSSNQQVDFTIHRAEKCLMMFFYPTNVVKSYDTNPTCNAPEIYNKRYINELKSYQLLERLECPFVPRLLDFCLEERWFSISRIHGQDLFALSQSQSSRLPYKSILRQLDQMNNWLRANEIDDMGHNIKDMILDESGKLYLVDFEQYKPYNFLGMKPDIYNTSIDDIIQRIFIRKGRKAKLTPQFIRLSISIMSKRPQKTMVFAFYYLALGLRDLVKQALRLVRR